MAKRALIGLALLLGLIGAALAAETPIPPAPTRWVTDPVGFLTPAVRDQLDARLERYQHATGHQVIVWIGTTLGGAPLEEWAANAFRAWGIGRKGEDDGVAIFVFRDDHAVRIEVGYGVEDKLPDAYASRIVREVMTPALRDGHPDEAIAGAVDQVLSRLGGEPGGQVAPPLTGAEPRSPAHDPFTIVFGAIALIAIIVFAIFHPRQALFMLWWVVSGGRGGGFGGGGGGGGFSGGGGRSGGGGASGSW